MRSYPRNSPEAAARIVALVLISDGHVCQSEYEAMSQLHGVRDLGLAAQDMPGIVQTLCEDLLMEGFDGRSVLNHVGDGCMASLMGDVDEPQLQCKVLRIAASAVRADRHAADGETAMLGAIGHHWGIAPVHAAGKTNTCGPLARQENSQFFQDYQCRII